MIGKEICSAVSLNRPGGPCSLHNRRELDVQQQQQQQHMRVQPLTCTCAPITRLGLTVLPALRGISCQRFLRASAPSRMASEL